MRRSRLPLGLLLPIALVLLVAALAALQYKWLGQVSEAEREELRASLEQRAREFADDFDREISRAYLVFQTDDAAFDVNAPGPFADRFDTWQKSARYPGLIREAYLSQPIRNQTPLWRYDAPGRRFESANWPDALTPARVRIEAMSATLRGRLSAMGRTPPPADSSSGPKALVVYAAGASLLGDVPALVLPIGQPASDPDGGRFLVLQLDTDYLEHTVMKDLVDRHFPEGGSDRYRVAVIDGRARPVLTRNLPAGASIDPGSADVAIPFFDLRVDIARDLAGSERMMTWGVAGSSTSPAATPLPQVNQFSIVVQRQADSKATIRTGHGGWQILLQHAAGSLDAAVTAARRRNLWMSFGILSVLAAGVGLVVLNARRSERLASQQMDFVATVSHELRTPLAVIRSAAQNLSAGVVREADQARRYGDLIETEGRRLTDMVEQVLEYAGLSGNRRPAAAGPVDAGALVRDVVSSCQPLFDAAGLEAVVEIAPDLPPVLADEPALGRALQNLVTNAVKYGADGRSVEVSARAAPARGAKEILLSVADRGRGIDPADLPHVFEPFYRGRDAVDRQIHGNGLGLSLVKRVAEAHGGRVTVASTPGAGATFTLHLPAASPDTAVRAVVTEPGPSRPVAG